MDIDTIVTFGYCPLQLIYTLLQFGMEIMLSRGDVNLNSCCIYVERTHDIDYASLFAILYDGRVPFTFLTRFCILVVGPESDGRVFSALLLLRGKVAWTCYRGVCLA